jgi:arylformamidase
MVTYPSDPKVKVRAFKKIPASSSNVSELVLGSHTGTHVDAKAHLANDAEGVDALPLDSLVGKCRVFDLTKTKKEITEKDLAKLDIKKGDIVLFKTRNSFLDEKVFHIDFVYFTLDAARYLRKKGVRTVGIDYVSVQKYKSGNSLVHSEFIENGITVFEHLNLRDVPAGEYFFVGLPLPLLGLDGAPARAVLIKQ